MNAEAIQRHAKLSGLTLVSEENGVIIYSLHKGGFTHTIKHWPNGMVEFIHHLFGRVHYSIIENSFDFNEILRLVF